MSAKGVRRQGVAILGSTGSIGTQALDVIAQSEGAFDVVALCAGHSDALLGEQIAKFRPRYASLNDEAAAERLRRAGHRGVTIASGPEAMVEAALLDGVDIVLVAVVGFAGLVPTLEALAAGRRVALANKETLVAAGDLVMEKVTSQDALLPVDSEHSAVFQTLLGRPVETVSKVTLTASGGPFRRTPAADMVGITPEQALQHPTWSMGGKITIDSATLMNKGLEVIEAVHLFRLDLDQVGVVIHPQSTIHSLVEFCDGSLLAQMAVADMRLPIAHALYFPQSAPRRVARLDLLELGKLEFESPDTERFPALQLAMDACRRGGTMPAVLNAANEVAVHAFLDGRLGFTQIPEVIASVMAAHKPYEVTLDTVMQSDFWAREQAHRLCRRR